MKRHGSLVASSVFLLATGTPGFGDTVDAKIRPDLRSSKWMLLSIDDPRRTVTTSPSLNKLFSPRSVGQAESADRTVLVAQAKLPSLKDVNLLAADQGGQALVVPNDGWFKPISGKEDDSAKVYEGQEAVYAFKDEKSAVFSKFSVLITGESRSNPKQIELMVADDSPTGAFRSVGILNIVNAKIVKSPYQELSFIETKAKYVKIKILATHWNTEMLLGQIRLLGTPEQ
jgi:hypothetical protein